MKGIYLAAFKAYHPNYNIIYQDINNKRDLGGDMMDIDISPYDFVIATPPCNYYSRANYRRETSKYSQITKHLLPDIIDKLCNQDKPFIVENVRNDNIFSKIGLYNKNCFIYKIGRHTYWTNIMLPLSNSKQTLEYIQNHRNQGGQNVHQVIEQFLDQVKDLLGE